MNSALAIFCKTIGLSEVKTRLAKTIGKEKATEFYRLSQKCILELKTELKHKHNITPYIAVAEKEGTAHSDWQTHNPLYTGTGSLGDRLHHIYHILKQKHDSVLIIGSDSPQLTTQTIIQAQTLLQQTPIVIGASYDGGFYLFGSTLELSKEIFTTVKYSQEDTLHQLENNLVHYKIAYLDKKEDADEIEDVKRIYTVMREMNLTDTQEELLEYIKTLL